MFRLMFLCCMNYSYRVPLEVRADHPYPPLAIDARNRLARAERHYFGDEVVTMNDTNGKITKFVA